MNCYLSGMIGIAMLAGSFATMSVTETQNNYLRENLSPELAIKYNKIVLERRNLYIQGLILGLFIAYFVLKIQAPVNDFHKITLVLAIALPFCAIYYMLMPKSDYMLNHLSSKEEIQAWLKVYKTMKTRYILGMVLGLLASIPISLSFCGSL